jgi:predicted HicB family RNase H-like nuclease
MLSYKGYTGEVEVDFEAGILHGRVLDLRDVITFEGSTPKKLEQAFRASIDDYLAFCKERGEDPEKPFSGNFMVRVSPDLHRRISIKAALANLSLNQWATEAFESHLSRGEKAGRGVRSKKG